MSLIELFRKKSRTKLFTTPSHAQSFYIYPKFRQFYKFDISETDTHSPQAYLKKAQEHAAKIYRTKSTYFLTNGSSSGIHAAVISTANKNDKVLVWRYAHPSHLNAIKLAGATPVFYDLSINEFGVPTNTPPDLVKNFLINDTIKAVIITSPTYEGYVSDVKSIKQICETFNTYLIVDEAHGALYPFSDELPQSAVNIADFTIQSLHKTAGGLNPTALLHVNCDLEVANALNMIYTTSPSYPLLATIEANINFLNSKKGRNKISQLIYNIRNLKNECNECIFGGDDITKILIKCTGKTGFELSKILYDEYDIEDEKTNEISSLLLCGIGTECKKLEKLKFALKKITKL